MIARAVVAGSLLAAALGGGLALGTGYFAALRRAVAGRAAGGSLAAFAALLLARLGVAAAGFTLAARYGPAVLLAAFVGFLGARAVALRAVRGGA